MQQQNIHKTRIATACIRIFQGYRQCLHYARLNSGIGNKEKVREEKWLESKRGETA